ncbi:MAG: Bax inhibitor-1 family protein [Myxococcales bacterium]|nr:Bax inhibitor-1 family protein [Myxococcales bacterium]
MANFTHNVPYQGWSVAQAKAETRTEFIHKTYQHLALAIALFIGLETLLLQIEPLWRGSLQLLRGWTWLAVLFAFGMGSNFAHRWAMSTTSVRKAYLGLGLYVVMQAFLFLPLLALATHVVGDPGLVMKAGWYTAIVFLGLTLTVLFSKADLSFLGGVLRVAFFAALATIVVGMLFGFTLGTWFAGLMVLFSGVSIAYETSKIVHHYRPGQHVAAALGLFASVALLFWYVLQLLMSSRD